MSREMEAALLEAGAVSAGVVEIGRLLPFMSAQNRERAFADMPRLGGLICGIFPYFSAAQEGNIALYARGLDYHKAVGIRLEGAVHALKSRYPLEDFKVYVDISPYPEKLAAAMAGLGVLGCNTLLITPRWGSYVFIGTIATSLPLAGGGDIRHCRGCSRCIDACPGGALGADGLDVVLCQSAITQKKGDLSNWEGQLLKNSGMIWGCDICQQVCPENAKIPLTPLEEFRNNLICSLNEETLAMNGKDFMRKYGNRAFAWRGIAPLRRNMKVLLEEDENKGSDII